MVSDKKSFKSNYGDSVKVYRLINTRFVERYTQQTNWLPAFLLMPGYESVQVDRKRYTYVVEDRSNVNTYKYTRILEEVMLPSVGEVFRHKTVVCQQDNCSIHTSAIAQN